MKAPLAQLYMDGRVDEMKYISTRYSLYFCVHFMVVAMGGD